MSDTELEELIAPVRDITAEAGKAIMEVYSNLDEVQTKSDGSPVTEADHRAHHVIVDGLRALTPGIPILSEESAQVPYAERAHWPQFWLVDPLDGTREFIHQRGEFTVNIALIRSGVPVLGVVGVPAWDEFFWGFDYQAYRQRDGGEARRIRVAHFSSGAPRVVASRSHASPETREFIDRVREARGDCELKSMGSALKICLVAEGEADVYPRLGPTSEWDIAAAHCVLRAAGGTLTTARGEPIRYNKENILNPWFVAAGTSDFDWIAITSELSKRSEQ
ncbi:MAG TPA: 3'(2'),5'-bisphosphate nucleotidase CysQ [Arenicellales bacterium]|nr:3'(2'),5'-bisphosphate nucleotidase CysQ [Arenicellales bacterium]